MKRLVGIFAAAVLVSGCATFVNTALDSAGRSAGDTVGKSIGDSVGRSMEQRIARELTPMVTRWYVSSMFAMAFGAGGYVVTDMDYEPGQWTRWQGLGEDEEGWMERAYLGADDKDNEWWRVKFHDSSEEETFVLEGLFSPERGELLRLRRLFPGDEDPVEVPVERDSYYVPPRQLAEESVEGAKVGTVEVTVPAGTFQAEHIRFGDVGGGTWEWWLNDEVPGGVVRYAQRSQGSAEEGADEALDPHDYDVRLLSHGDDAESELGVMDQQPES